MINERIISLTYKVLTTTQPPYLHNPISNQRPRSTRSSYVVTLARPPTSSILKSLIAPFLMLHLVSGINSLYLFVNLILVPVPPFPTHLFLQSSLLPLLIHHSAHPSLPLSFTPGLYPRSFTSYFRTAFVDYNARTVSSKLLNFFIYFSLFLFLCRVLD